MPSTPAREPGSKSSGKSRDRPAYRCTECGWTALRWVGRCGECQAWGTVEEMLPKAGVTRARPIPDTNAARPIADVDAESADTWATGVGELDRVLGGGLVGGSVVLLAGEPGVGKSTLLLDVASRAAIGHGDGHARTVLYITGEESAGQVRLRAERIGALRPRLLLAAENDLATVLGHVEAASPDLLIVDSVQTVASQAVESAPGSVSQVREVAASLIKVAKQRGMATVLVGHVTKDGGIAGPRVLEHLVDVVCQFEGDRHTRLRMVRAVKNRYGPTDEVGCFELSEVGILELSDPSGLFLSQYTEPVPGTAVTVSLEGRRPLVGEVQALVAPTVMTNPRRVTSGLDASRVSMVLAVLDRRAGANLFRSDIYVSTVGGARMVEPACDLAVAVAVMSAGENRPVPPGTVLFGEVGLAGEVRPVPGLSRRLSEAARLGFRFAVVPVGCTDQAPAPDGMQIFEVPDLMTALQRSIHRSDPLPPPEPHLRAL
jgi:DNA repair protein RadA/Sms